MIGRTDICSLHNGDPQSNIVASTTASSNLLTSRERLVADPGWGALIIMPSSDVRRTFEAEATIGRRVELTIIKTGTPCVCRV